jgi:hypothetical protein
LNAKAGKSEIHATFTSLGGTPGSPHNGVVTVEPKNKARFVFSFVLSDFVIARNARSSKKSYTGTEF